jgi:hypothetical protein
MELGDDATYLLRGVGSISFQMPSGDVLELDHILLVPSLRKNLLLVSCMTYIHWRVSFEGQQCTIRDCSLASPRNLARGVREGGLYMLLSDPVAHVHSSGRLEEPSIFEEANAWKDVIEPGSTSDFICFDSILC